MSRTRVVVGRTWDGRPVTDEGYTRCATCELIVFGAPGEVSEAYGK